MMAIFRFTLFVLCCFSPFSLHAASFVVQGLDEEVLNDNVELVLQSQDLICEPSELDNVVADKAFISQKVIQSLQPFGYFSPKVTIDINNQTDECVIVRVDQGKPTYLNQVIIEVKGSGSDIDLFNGIIKAADIQKGQIVLDQKFQSLKSKLKTTALDKGYLDAKFEQTTIDVYPEKYQADIKLIFDTGSIYRFSDINFIQAPEIMDADYLQKMIDIRKGDEVISQSMIKARDTLMETQYFSQIFMELDVDRKQSNTIPLNIRIYPADRMKHTFKVGFSTDTGPRAGYGFEHYRVNEFGDQISFESSISELTKDVAFNFKRPSRKKPTKTAYNWGLGYQETESQGVKNQTYKTGINQVRKLGKYWENINYIDLSYQVDTYDGQSEDFWLLVPGVSWVYTRADNLVRPRHGIRWRFNVQGATEYVISNASFIQVNIENNWIQSLGLRHRLLTRFGIGQTWVSDTQDLPTSFRYFTGGDNTVRGYAFESIAPVLSDDERPGGINQMVASVEYEYSFARSWAIATFYDVGSAYNGNLNLQHGAGFGIRWFSPIGPARLDFGFPLSNEAENDFRIHVTFGADF